MYALNERQAFEAMRRFVAAYFRRTNGKGDLATLLTDMEMQRDGSPNDPAAWDDWIEVVKQVKEE